MALNIEYIVRTTKNSLIQQLKSANSLYDVVRELTQAAQDLPPEQSDLKIRLEAEALKVYEQAVKISDEAALIGKNLAEMVG